MTDTSEAQAKARRRGRLLIILVALGMLGLLAAGVARFLEGRALPRDPNQEIMPVG